MMTNFNTLKELRTKEEFVNYFEKRGQSITEEEIESIKKGYEETQGSINVLNYNQLNKISGGMFRGGKSVNSRRQRKTGNPSSLPYKSTIAPTTPPTVPVNEGNRPFLLLAAEAQAAMDSNKAPENTREYTEALSNHPFYIEFLSTPEGKIPDPQGTNFATFLVQKIMDDTLSLQAKAKSSETEHKDIPDMVKNETSSDKSKRVFDTRQLQTQCNALMALYAFKQNFHLS